MQTEMLELWQKPSRRQFSRPPMRSHYFWAETLFLLITAAIALFLTAVLRSRLSGQMVLTMGLPFAMLTILWFGVLGVHQTVYELYGDELNSVENRSEDEVRVGILLDKLAFLSYAGFAYAASAVGLAYGGLLPVALLARH